MWRQLLSSMGKSWSFIPYTLSLNCTLSHQTKLVSCTGVISLCGFLPYQVLRHLYLNNKNFTFKSVPKPICVIHEILPQLVFEKCLKQFVIKCIRLESYFKSRIQWSTQIYLEIAWFSLYFANKHGRPFYESKNGDWYLCGSLYSTFKISSIQYAFF